MFTDRQKLVAAAVAVCVSAALITARLRHARAPATPVLVAARDAAEPEESEPAPAPAARVFRGLPAGPVPIANSEGDAGAAEVADDFVPPPPLLVLDSEGKPTLDGKPVDPDSPEYRKLVPPGTQLPTREQVDQQIKNLEQGAEDCFRAESGGEKGGVLATNFVFRGGDAPPPPDVVPFPDPPAVACLHARVSQNGQRDGQFVLSTRGAWTWSVYHEFKIPPR